MIRFRGRSGKRKEKSSQKLPNNHLYSNRVGEGSRAERRVGSTSGKQSKKERYFKERTGKGRCKKKAMVSVSSERKRNLSGEEAKGPFNRRC